MRLLLPLLLLACTSGGDNDAIPVDTSMPGALPVAGTYRAAFEGDFSACDVGIANDRILSIRRQYVLVLPKNSWNFYVEYATEFATDDWPGAAAKNKFRLNVSYTIPVG